MSLEKNAYERSVGMSFKRVAWSGLIGVMGIGVWLALSQLTPTSKGETSREIELLSAVKQPRQMEVESGLSCSDATNEINAFPTYESVRLKLNGGQPVKNIEYLDCFLDSDGISDEPAAVLEEFTGSVFVSDVMYSYLLIQYEKNLKKIQELSRDGAGVGAWNIYIFGQSIIRAYDSTAEERFIDLYVEYFDRLLSVRDSELGFYDDYHKMEMNSWGTSRFRDSTESYPWLSHVTHFSVIMLPATALARRIKAQPELARHTDFADRVITYFGAAYEEFDSDVLTIPGSEVHWYWRPAVNKFEATNHLHLQGQVLLNMYALTGEAEYRQRVTEILAVFEAGLTIDAQGLAAWNYHPYFQVEEALSDHNAIEDSEFVWKAGLTIPFLYQAEADGFAIDPEVLGAVTKTIVENVLADGDYALNFHPKNEAKHTDQRQKEILDKYNGKTRTITRYLSAASKNPAVPRMILETVTNRPDLFPSGWFGSVTMAEGYAFYLRGAE